MTFKNLMANMTPGEGNDAVLQAASVLAESFGAGVTGIAACQPLFVAYGDAYISGDVIDADRQEISKDLQELEAAFRKTLDKPGRALEWRSNVALIELSDYVAREARCADLVIAGVSRAGAGLGGSRVVSVPDLVMLTGRPTLLVPDHLRAFNFASAILAWKESREARRAAYDALPLLKKATSVTVVEVSAKDELAAAETRLSDVVGWLGRHGVAARPMVTLGDGDDAIRLDSLAQDQGAGLLVAGAYGHSRAREWMFGGVTRDLLMRPETYCTLLSH